MCLLPQRPRGQTGRPHQEVSSSGIWTEDMWHVGGVLLSLWLKFPKMLNLPDLCPAVCWRVETAMASPCFRRSLSESASASFLTVTPLCCSSWCGVSLLSRLWVWRKCSETHLNIVFDSNLNVNLFLLEICFLVVFSSLITGQRPHSSVRVDSGHHGSGRLHGRRVLYLLWREGSWEEMLRL